MDYAGKPVPFIMDKGDLPDVTLSPDGSMFSYGQKVGDAIHLWAGPTSNREHALKIVDSDSYNGRMVWDPKGITMTYISDRDGKNELYLFNRMDGKSTRLTDNDLREKYVTWSPDGSRIAVTMQTDNTSPADIYLITIADKSVERLTESEVNEEEISWSPSGKYIAYHGNVNKVHDIYIIDIQRKAVRKLTSGNGYQGAPDWILE